MVTRRPGSMASRSVQIASRAAIRFQNEPDALSRRHGATWVSHPAVLHRPGIDLERGSARPAPGASSGWRTSRFCHILISVCT